MACAVSTETAPTATTPTPTGSPNPHGLPDSSSFDPGLGWRLHPQVAVRPEPFGALLYHFGNRRLSFLKSRRLLELVQELGRHGTARDAALAVGIDATQWPRYESALARLVDSEILTPLTGARPEETTP